MPAQSNLVMIDRLKGMIHECLRDYVRDDLRHTAALIANQMRQEEPEVRRS
jgi:hypothetical protein